jgi:hypothetical protein
MRNLTRTTAVLACVAVLLALPAHAAPPQRSPAVAQASPAQAVATWLGSLWTDLTRIFAPGASRPAGSGSQTQSISRPGQPRFLGTTQAGSCIDPDGCLQY